jgi:hypothetical protein
VVELPAILPLRAQVLFVEPSTGEHLLLLLLDAAAPTFFH